MTAPRRTFGLVPAAGQSRRMGQPKLLLTLHGQTVLERVVAALRQGGADMVLVITAPESPELPPLAQRAGAEVLVLAQATADMRATVQHGIRHLEVHQEPGAGDWLLLSPADHPCLAKEVVQGLLAARDGASAPILVPAYQGRRGHPLLLSWQVVPRIRALPPEQGLNALLRSQPELVREVPMEDASILVDLDTPEDYARLQAQGRG